MQFYINKHMTCLSAVNNMRHSSVIMWMSICSQCIMYYNFIIHKLCMQFLTNILEMLPIVKFVMTCKRSDEPTLQLLWKTGKILTEILQINVNFNLKTPHVQLFIDALPQYHDCLAYSINWQCKTNISI